MYYATMRFIHCVCQCLSAPQSFLKGRKGVSIDKSSEPMFVKISPARVRKIWYMCDRNIQARAGACPTHSHIIVLKYLNWKIWTSWKWFIITLLHHRHVYRSEMLERSQILITHVETSAMVVSMSKTARVQFSGSMCAFTESVRVKRFYPSSMTHSYKNKC